MLTFNLSGLPADEQVAAIKTASPEALKRASAWYSQSLRQTKSGGRNGGRPAKAPPFLYAIMRQTGEQKHDREFIGICFSPVKADAWGRESPGNVAIDYSNFRASHKRDMMRFWADAKIID